MGSKSSLFTNMSLVGHGCNHSSSPFFHHTRQVLRVTIWRPSLFGLFLFSFLLLFLLLLHLFLLLLLLLCALLSLVLGGLLDDVVHDDLDLLLDRLRYVRVAIQLLGGDGPVLSPGQGLHPVNKGDQVLMLGLYVVSERAGGALVHHGHLGQVAEDHQVKEGGGVAEEELLLAKHLGQNLQVVLRQLVKLLGGGLAESVALPPLEAVFAEQGCS